MNPCVHLYVLAIIGPAFLFNDGRALSFLWTLRASCCMDGLGVLQWPCTIILWALRASCCMDGLGVLQWPCTIIFMSSALLLVVWMVSAFYNGRALSFYELCVASCCMGGLGVLQWPCTIISTSSAFEPGHWTCPFCLEAGILASVKSLSVGNSISALRFVCMGDRNPGRVSTQGCIC